MRSTTNTTTYLMAALAAAFLFGAATPASKAMLSGIEAQSLAGLLYLGAALGVLPAVLSERNRRWPWRGGRATVLLLGGAIVLGGVAGPLLLLLGLKAASSGSVSLWLNLEFVATVILGHFFFKERLSVRGWVAAAGTLIAAMVLAGDTVAGGVLPAVLIAGGCLCWGFDNHFTALIDGISPAQTTLWKGLAAGCCNLLIGMAVTGGIGRWHTVIAALLVGAASYGISMTLYIRAAQGLGATRSQMVFSAAPFFGLLLAVTVLGETFTVPQALAAVLITLSFIFLFSEKHAHLHRHDRMAHQHSHRHDEMHHDHTHDPSQKDTDHSHWHEHRPEQHEHSHWPDLHHRHGHDDTKE